MPAPGAGTCWIPWRHHPARVTVHCPIPSRKIPRRRHRPCPHFPGRSTTLQGRFQQQLRRHRDASAERTGSDIPDQNREELDGLLKVSEKVRKAAREYTESVGELGRQITGRWIRSRYHRATDRDNQESPRGSPGSRGRIPAAFRRFVAIPGRYETGPRSVYPMPTMSPPPG